MIAVSITPSFAVLGAVVGLGVLLSFLGACFVRHEAAAVVVFVGGCWGSVMAGTLLQALVWVLT